MCLDGRLSLTQRRDGRTTWWAGPAQRTPCPTLSSTLPPRRKPSISQKRIIGTSFSRYVIARYLHQKAITYMLNILYSQLRYAHCTGVLGKLIKAPNLLYLKNITTNKSLICLGNVVIKFDKIIRIWLMLWGLKLFLIPEKNVFLAIRNFNFVITRRTYFFLCYWDILDYLLQN